MAGLLELLQRHMNRPVGIMGAVPYPQMPDMMGSAYGAEPQWQERGGLQTRVNSGQPQQPAGANPNVTAGRNLNLGTGAGPVVPGSLVDALMKRGIPEAQARAMAAAQGR